MKKIILGSIILSIIQSILFFDKNPGISVAIFTILSICLILFTLKEQKKIKNKKALLLSIPIILLGCTYFIYSNTFFGIFNIFVMMILTAIMIIWTIYDKVEIPDTLLKICTVWLRPIEFLDEAVRKTKKNFKSNKEKDEKKNTKVVKQIVRAVLISIPLVIVILALLMSADTVFADMFKQIDEWIEKILNYEFFTTLIFRIIIIIIVFFYIVSFIINFIKFNNEENESGYNKKEIKIEAITINTILTILNIIYLIFSIIQVSYLFTKIGVTEDFNYAEYARQGFFQLMIVSFINFVIIIITSINKTNTAIKYTKFMNILLAIFTIVMIISSFVRMNMYETEFGYTFLRLMVYIILITELLMIIPTIIYICNKKINLLKSYIIIATTMYLVVNFINIDKIIASKNIDRYLANTNEREIDFYYLKENLSIDAVPEILNLYENVDNIYLKRQINNYLYREYKDLKEERSWQEFNISKHRAEKLLEKMNLKYEI